MDDTTICDKIIEGHKLSPNKKEGIIGLNEIDKSIKDSTDIVLQDHKEICEEYVRTCLDPATKAYIEKYPWCNSYSAWKVVDNIFVQHYKPNGGFYAWHTERGAKFEMNVSRHLVFMTYLNDVSDGGETEFFHQQLKIKPEKGLTLIWGSDWTFTHRGIPSPTEDKYIVTGWFNFV